MHSESSRTQLQFPASDTSQSVLEPARISFEVFLLQYVVKSMFYDLKLVRTFAFVLLAVFTVSAQTGQVTLKSPNEALEISIATVRGQSVQPDGGQLSYSVNFRGQPVIQWSKLGLALEAVPAIGPAIRIESSRMASQD